MNEPRYQAPQQQQQQQSDGIPITEEPPKIKVVVRKRPINRKVRTSKLPYSITYTVCFELYEQALNHAAGA